MTCPVCDTPMRGMKWYAACDELICHICNEWLKRYLDRIAEQWVKEVKGL